MTDLIEALKIFAKYKDDKWPTWCCHDELHVTVAYDEVSEEDKKRLEKLSFIESDGGFVSFRFGSC